MKNTRIFTFLVILLCSLTTWAASPKREFRATWVTTAASIDWPKYKARNETGRKAQQLELTYILDELVKSNMNAVCFQVRGRSDAFYKSSYEPWSQDLTDTRGQDPGYDPLAFAIEEAHKRGLELHVWVNPFRVTTTGSLPTSDKVYQNCKQWILKYNNGSFDGQFLDPGYPEARAYVKKVLMEIVNKYDIDGMIMDDYFYPYGGTTTQDATSKAQYKPASMSDADWRRSNVDAFVKDMYNAIQTSKPWVRFGISPFGIWTTSTSVAQKYGIALPSGISGMNAYDQIACNTVEWVKQGWVDYIAPQIYWSTSSTKQDYDVLSKWWSQKVCKFFSNSLPGEKRVESFVAHLATDFSADELGKQIQDNRDFNLLGGAGSIFFSTIDYTGIKTKTNTKHTTIKGSKFTQLALPPSIEWKSSTTLAAPTNLTVSGTTVSWSHSTASRFTVYIYSKGTASATAMKDPTNLKGVVYGKSFDASGISNLNNMTIAVCAYDRYGVEHTAALYNAAAGSEEPKEDIKWVLNGGQVNAAVVPTQEELWTSFKADAGLASALGTLASIKTGDMTTACKTICTKLVAANVQTVFGKSSWTWLYNYIMTTQNQQAGDVVAGSTVPELTSDLTQSTWRYAIAAFFLETQFTAWPYSANFATAGKPSAWGTAYLDANGGGSLPTTVSAPFTLPTPTHPDGCKFMGWYDNANFSGSAITVIPAGWKGTLYAKWDCGNETPQPDKITWVLNGGQVNSVAVPTQEELWASFKADAGLGSTLGTLAEIAATSAGKPHTDSSNPCGCRVICSKLTSAMVETVFAKSNWTWLKNYLISVQSTLPASLSDASWRYAIAAFFMQTEHNAWPATANFATAGQPSAWGTAYQAANGGGSLPTTVSAPFTLPTPTHPDGCKFMGWYDNANFSGAAITVIPAGWVGTLYAKWHCNDVDITWELNGGYVPGAGANVPSQEELWASFKTDAAITALGTLSEIASTTSTTPCQKVCGSLLAENLVAVFAKSNWTWLKTYIQGVQAAQVGTTVVGTDGTTRAVTELPNDISSAAVQWRYSTAAFFLQTQYTAYPATANFATAGQPSAWGSAYPGAQGGGSVSLPTSVSAPYTLPTPVHPKGYKFLGWYDNPNFSGSPITVIPAGWIGTLYAKWQTATDVENIILPHQAVKIYDLMGRYVGNSIENVGRGTYIIVTENSVFKAVL